jgi:predicted nucleic-acid-binding Zn-ribbon protein
MPIRPKPYRLKCPKCGYSKRVQLSGDCLPSTPSDIWAMSSSCPVCKSTMNREEIENESTLEKIFTILSKRW